MISKPMRIVELKEHSKDFGSIQLSGDDGGFVCMARLNVPAKELWHLRVGQELIVNVEVPNGADGFVQRKTLEIARLAKLDAKQ